MNWSRIGKWTAVYFRCGVTAEKRPSEPKIDRIISAHDSLSLLIIKIGGTCSTSAAGCSVSADDSLLYLDSIVGYYLELSWISMDELVRRIFLCGRVWCCIYLTSKLGQLLLTQQYVIVSTVCRYLIFTLRYSCCHQHSRTHSHAGRIWIFF